jgi:predicted phage terminase large subunit-like protein
VWVEHLLDLAVRWKPIAWAEEGGQIKSSVGPFLDRRQRERKIPLYRRPFPTKGDKSVRAQSIRGLMSLHGLYVPTKAAWYSAFQEELLRFPAGKHDDQVDALGLIGQMLDVIMPGLPPQKDAKHSLPKDYVEIDDDRLLEGRLKVCLVGTRSRLHCSVHVVGAIYFAIQFLGALGHAALEVLPLRGRRNDLLQLLLHLIPHGIHGRGLFLKCLRRRRLAHRPHRLSAAALPAFGPDTD